jgi:hypothetical protein
MTLIDETKGGCCRSGFKAETKGRSAKVKKERDGALPAVKSTANGAPTVGRGAVAQMGERCNRTAEVRGSIPLSSTSPIP